MRIIAGEARGHVIFAPKGMETRPTLDRVRESLFSILMQRIPGAHILDLFAGSGALGLESLSRGATYAVFVDHARLAQEAIRQNIKALGFQERAQLFACDWRRALSELSVAKSCFDVIFLDPPYSFPDISEVFSILSKGKLLAEDGRILFEHDSRTALPAHDWKIINERRYGDTSITFFSW